MDKHRLYEALVAARKQCRLCMDLHLPDKSLINPSEGCYRRYDSDEIGPWSRWQGNLDTRLMIVGQDWGDATCYLQNKGQEPPNNPTNLTLIHLLHSIGIAIGPPSVGGEESILLTNAILCLKKGGLQAPVRTSWFNNCGERFLVPLIEIVRPNVLVTLGTRAYDSIRKLYGLRRMEFRRAVEAEAGLQPLNGIAFFPMYHCGRRVLNMYRSIKQQEADWRRVKQVLY